METNQNKSKLKKNLLWILLLLILILLSIYLGYRILTSNPPDNPGPNTTEELPSGISTPNPPIVTNLNISDPSPVYVGQDFSLSLVNDHNKYKKSYYVDNGSVCDGLDVCKIQIPVAGRHKLKICIDNFNLCDEIEIDVLDNRKNEETKSQSSAKKDCQKLQKNKGDECDDNNMNTIDDRINKFCECIGKPKSDIKPKIDFKCGGETPEIVIKPESPNFKTAINFDCGNSNCFDSEVKFDWDFDSDGNIDKGNIKSPSYTFEGIGKFKVRMILTDRENPSNVKEISKLIEVKLTKTQLEDILKPILKVGQLGGSNKAGHNAKVACDKSTDILNKLVTSTNIMVKDGSGIDKNNLMTFINSDLKAPNKYFDLEVTRIDFDISTGKIKSFRCNLKIN
ncbi:MAG: PKD domain-containing protein [Saprospiraceae bacterium]|nr:PKD domain-containing protein [Saprospiraceae bacterium]